MSGLDNLRKQLIILLAGEMEVAINLHIRGNIIIQKNLLIDKCHIDNGGVEWSYITYGDKT